jgi:hypothetical protein
MRHHGEWQRREPGASHFGVTAGCGLAARLPLERVRKVLKIAKEPLSLETPIGDEEDSQLGDLIEDKNAILPIDAAIQSNLRETTTRVLAFLTPREERCHGRYCTRHILICCAFEKTVHDSTSVRSSIRFRIGYQLVNSRSYPPPARSLAKQLLPVTHESSHGPAGGEPRPANAVAHA